MNIFVLDADPAVAAQCLADQHINKMIVEYCQLLATAHDKNLSPYKHTHFNHPCAKWVRKSYANYVWLLECAGELINERYHRWPERKAHKTERVWLWYAKNAHLIAREDALTDFALAMPVEFQSADAVASYRLYYASKKMRLNGKESTWTNRSRPSWLESNVKQESL